ncbi:putative aspartate aminotransferase [Trypoxylus dichotomus]
METNTNSIGVKRVTLQQLDPNLNNALIIAIIISKQRPRRFNNSKNNESRAVWNFTIRDSPWDYINVTFWGNGDLILKFCSNFQVGDIVEITKPRILIRDMEAHGEQYRPMVTSPYYLVLYETQSNIVMHSGNLNYHRLLSLPTKPLAGFVTLSDIQTSGSGRVGYFVDILVAVKTIGTVRSVKTREGIEQQVRDVMVFDHTCPVGVRVALWDPDLITRLCKLSIPIYVPLRRQSFWSKIPLGPPDPIYGLTEAYKICKNPKRVNLAIGTYQDDKGKPYVLKCVKKAEKLLDAMRLNKEYTSPIGYESYRKLCEELALGKDSKLIKSGLLASVQCISRTGSLRLALDFIKAFYAGKKVVFLPYPTWGNHKHLARETGLAYDQYRYYDYKAVDMDYKGIVDDVSHKIPDGAIVLFHACAHNPSGVDPNRSQWEELSDIVKKKNLLVIFDMAYHGFASGHIEVDAYSVRKFIEDGNKCMIIQSFAKNMGLYGERPGCLILTADSAEERDIILSQFEAIIKSMYHYPPIHGARIVEKILGDTGLKSEWKLEFKMMSDRLISIRRTLKTKLQKEGSIRSWDHIVKQCGMFCLTGLSKTQVKRLIDEHSIFLSTTGRISIGENPVGAEANNLRSYAITAPVQPTEILERLSEAIGSTNSIQNVMSVRQVLDKMEMLSNPATETNASDRHFTALLYVLVTHLDLDGLSKIVTTRCSKCKVLVPNNEKFCENFECNLEGDLSELDSKFDLKINISDHTGSLVNCRLTGTIAENVLDCTVEQFSRMTDAEKCHLKWKYLMERCAIRIMVLCAPGTNPLCSILSCALATPNEVANKLRHY